MEALQTIEKVIDSNYRIAALETSETERLQALFKRLTLNTGRAVYHWTPGSGLYRLGVEHIFIPRTRAPTDVVAYISASRHYGIYLLESFGSALAKDSVQRGLHGIAARDDSIHRLVMLTGSEIIVPESLRPFTAIIRHNVRPRDKANG